MYVMFEKSFFLFVFRMIEHFVSFVWCYDGVFLTLFMIVVMLFSFLCEFIEVREEGEEEKTSK